MTGSPVLSLNLTNRKNPAKPNYHISIKKSQAKCTENIGLPAVELKKVVSVTNMVSSCEPERIKTKRFT